MDITPYDNKVHSVINARLGRIRKQLRSYCRSVVDSGDIDELCAEFTSSVDGIIDDGVRGVWAVSDDLSGRMAEEAQERGHDKGKDIAAMSLVALLTFMSRKGRVTAGDVMKGLARQTRSAIGLVSGTVEEQARQMARFLERPSEIARETNSRQPAVISNVRRHVVTEIAVAYRTAEHHAWQVLPFVVGQEIRPGKNHPVTDICDDLKGRYPKEFKFTGWHPWCRCFAHPLYSWDSEKVTDMPENYVSWATAQKKRKK